MSIAAKLKSERLPWYAWPLIPFVFPVAVLVMVPLGLLALLSIPYFLIFPDRHAHIYDFEGNERQKQLLKKWRIKYRKLTICQRVDRGYTLWCRQRRRSKFPKPRHVNRTLRVAAERTRQMRNTQ